MPLVSTGREPALKDSSPQTSHGLGARASWLVWRGPPPAATPTPASPCPGQQETGPAWGPGALPLLAPWLQAQRLHKAILRGPQAVRMAPVLTQQGPSAFWAPGGRPALTLTTAPRALGPVRAMPQKGQGRLCPGGWR